MELKKGVEVRIIGNSMRVDGYIHEFEPLINDSELIRYSLRLHNHFRMLFGSIKESKIVEGVYNTDNGYTIAITEDK